jgi:hypothetical protein
MSRIALAALLFAALARPAAADVTLTQTTGGKGMGMNAQARGTTYIKGMKMRTDTVMGDITRTVIFDLDAQRMFAFDSTKKEAEVFEMAAFAEQTLKATNATEINASITPNGKTKEIDGQTATGYDMAITMPSQMGPDPSMKMVVSLTGPVWIVKDAPGAAEWAAFYKAAADKGWIFGDPRTTRGNAGQGRSMMEMYRQMAETGGVAYETEINIAMKGDGPMAARLQQMGGMQAATKVEAISTTPIDDALFAPPADYTITPRK